MPVHKEHFIDKLAKLNGVLTGIALYPQLIKVILTGVKENLSVTAFAIIFINSIVWVVYARHRRITPLIVASALNGIAAAILMVLAFPA